MLRQQQTTAACTDSAVTKLDNLIDRMKLAGRQTAESWLGPVVSDAQAHERRLSAMTHCLTGIVLAPMIAAPVLLIAFSWISFISVYGENCPLSFSGGLFIMQRNEPVRKNFIIGAQPPLYGNKRLVRLNNNLIFSSDILLDRQGNLHLKTPGVG